jgi:hypothetical protein
MQLHADQLDEKRRSRSNLDYVNQAAHLVVAPSDGAAEPMIQLAE